RREGHDRAAERAGLPGVREGEREGALGQAEPDRPDAEAAAVEHSEELAEAGAALPEQCLGAQLDAVEAHGARVAGAPADLPQRRARAGGPPGRPRPGGV